jgi:hypothetical protein
MTVHVLPNHQTTTQTAVLASQSAGWGFDSLAAHDFPSQKQIVSQTKVSAPSLR